MRITRYPFRSGGVKVDDALDAPRRQAKQPTEFGIALRPLLPPKLVCALPLRLAQVLIPAV